MPFSWISFEETTKWGEETTGWGGGGLKKQWGGGGGVEETLKGEIVNYILLKCYSR